MFTISDVRYKININIRIVAKFAALLYYDKKKSLPEKKKQENAFVNNVHCTGGYSNTQEKILKRDSKLEK